VGGSNTTGTSAVDGASSTSADCSGEDQQRQEEIFVDPSLRYHQDLARLFSGSAAAAAAAPAPAPASPTAATATSAAATEELRWVQELPYQLSCIVHITGTARAAMSAQQPDSFGRARSGARARRLAFESQQCDSARDELCSAIVRWPVFRHLTSVGSGVSLLRCCVQCTTGSMRMLRPKYMRSNTNIGMQYVHAMYYHDLAYVHATSSPLSTCQ
jgi:hypothetical protein